MVDVGGLLISHPAWAWVAVGAILLVAELKTGSGWLLWPAGSAALVAFAVLIAPLSFAMAVLAFVAMTVITTYLGRRFMPKAPPPEGQINDRRARVVGQRGTVATAFQSGRGRVFVDGKEWAAEIEGEAAPTVGADVEVLDIVGSARLKVRAE